MRQLDSTLLLTLSEVFANLSAGWFGAAFILPAFSEKPLSFNFPILLMDIVFGIVCFAAAYKLNKVGGK